MYPLLLDSTSSLVQQHIDDLRRDAALHRLVRRRREHTGHCREAPVLRLQRAPSP